MSDNKTLIDPKELVPAGLGFVLGIGILALLYLVAVSLDLQLLVEKWNLPRQ